MAMKLGRIPGVAFVKAMADDEERSLAQAERGRCHRRDRIVGGKVRDDNVGDREQGLDLRRPYAGIAQKAGKKGDLQRSIPPVAAPIRCGKRRW
jgi:hypothetical protein